MRTARLLRTFEELQPLSGKANSAVPLRTPGARLRVLQFNVLADGLAQYGNFAKAPPAALEWAYRAPLILEEVLSAKPDVICMQEVNHYDDFFRPNLEAAGYKGVFAPKCPSPAERYGYGADGCCLFYSSDRLSPLSAPIDRKYIDDDGQCMSQGFLAWPLHDRASGALMLLATTHLKAKSSAECEADRYRQAKQLVDGILELQKQTRFPSVKSNGNGSAPDGAGSPACHIVLAGDFNTTDDSDAFLNLRDAGLQSLWDYIPTQPSPLPNFTTWKYRPDADGNVTDVKRVIDYIWYSEGLTALRRWSPLSVEAIGADGLPSWQYPSDHIALCCDLLVDE